MIRNLILAGAFLAAMAAPAFSAEPIEGTWLRPSNGALVKFSKCGNSYCAKAVSGEFAGKSVGKFSGSGSSYSGTLTDLKENKTYSGNAKVTGNTMKLEGCVLKVFCKGENWKRQ